MTGFSEYSFTNFAGYGEWKFVGLRNYANLLSDDRIRSSYLFTFQLAILSTILVNVIALAIALGLNANIGFRNALRGVYFIPKVLAILVVGYIFNFFFRTSLPVIGERLGIEALSTSGRQRRSPPILYLAGLQTVPADVYEAARIDGAGTWRRFRSRFR